jgi:hypothetical protein
VTTPEADLDVWLEYFEHFAHAKGPEDEFVRGLAILRRWKVMADGGRLDREEFERILQLLEAEEDPGSGWFGAWNRIVAWGVARGLTERRANPWTDDA